MFVGKYESIPIPQAEIKMNQGDLITAATAEKNAWIENLRGYFERTSRQKLLEARVSEADSLQKELNYIPWVIFVG